jgi:acyl-CoA reductase-like NAD-dependent aldehyde dehydrogenase
MNDATKVARAGSRQRGAAQALRGFAPAAAGPHRAGRRPAKDLLQVVQGRGADVGAAWWPTRRAHDLVHRRHHIRPRHRPCGGDRLVPAALELGGKSPHVVFADANLEHAVAAVVAGIFGSAGQSCVAGSRLFIEASIYDQVLSAVVARARGLRLALPDADGVEMGPLASFHHRERVAAFVDRARAEGGRILCGGAAPTGGDFDQGAFYLPTVIDGLDAQALSCQKKPSVRLVVLPFKDEEDLIAQANGTAFGLACGIWTENFKRAGASAARWRRARCGSTPTSSRSSARRWRLQNTASAARRH